MEKTEEEDKEEGILIMFVWTDLLRLKKTVLRIQFCAVLLRGDITIQETQLLT